MAASSLLTRIKQRLAKTTDSEAEQAIKIRLVIGIAVLLYFCMPWAEDETWAEALLAYASLMSIAYYLAAIAIVVAIMINPKPSPIRRVFGMILDLVPLSILMYLAGSDTLFFFVAYLWVILGNGFRFGVNYLYIASGISLTGFTYAIVFGDYWQIPGHQPFGWSLFLVLLLVPLYSAFLIKKLHTAIDSAKQANQAKSRFLANMSHELRTPLNGVIGIADLIAETPLNKQQHEFVKIMRNSANTLLGLIENVLDISKIEAGKIQIDQSSFDLHVLINNVMQLQKPMGAAKGLLVSTYIAPEVPFNIEGDSQHLKQVLINLLGNAIKFTEHGAVKLSVSQQGLHDQKNVIRFEIRDTGIGMSPEFLTTIFEDFRQAPEISRSRISGTGLGTTIAKELVELMGGEIGVSSEQGKGTLFWFEVPFTVMSEQPLKFVDHKILLLSKDTTRQQIEPALLSWDLAVTFADNSVKAFAELMKQAELNQPYTTLLIDQSCLQDIDPVPYARMLRTEPALANLSLVLVNPKTERVRFPELTDHFISVVNNFQDKRLLFNALHAANSVPVLDEKIVSLSSHYTAISERPLRILVAEDNLVNQQVLTGILEHAGVKTLVAENGEEALELLSQQLDEIDMLILDMNMPEYSGIEVTQALHYMETTRQIPVIILTADATPETQQLCLEAGVDAFLTKPVNSHTLLKQVSALAAQLPLPDESMAPSRDQATPSLLDEQKLQELASLGRDDSFMQTIIRGFEHDGNKHLALIQAAAHDDYLTYRESLHALKGSATEMGAQQLVKLCHQAEQCKPDEIGQPHLMDLCQQIELTFHQSLTAMAAYLTGTHSSQFRR